MQKSREISSRKQIVLRVSADKRLIDHRASAFKKLNHTEEAVDKRIKTNSSKIKRLALFSNFKTTKIYDLFRSDNPDQNILLLQVL